MAKDDQTNMAERAQNGTRMRIWGTVSGRVQGVGFRAFVRKQGEQLRLDGWVRNLPDGRVEFDAAGAAEAIAELKARLARGPFFARVDHLDCAEAEVSAESPHGPEAGSGFGITA